MQPFFSSIANAFTPYRQYVQHQQQQQALVGTINLPNGTTFRYKRLPEPSAHARPMSIPIPIRPLRSKRTAAAQSPAAASPIMQMTDQRAATLFARTYADLFGGTLEEAHRKLRQADQTLYHSWRNLKTLNEVAWSPTADDQPRGAYDLVYGASSLVAYLYANPAADEASARSMAQHYLTQSPTIVMDESDLSNFYQGVLQRGLHWIDPEKVRANHLSATQILQTVCRHRRPDIKTRAALTERLQHRRDVIIDEAALIAFNAQSGSARIAPDAPMQRIRAHYASALIDEWQDAALGLSLLPSAPIAPAHAAFWYDGAVLQNARGQNLTQIARALYASLASLPSAEEEPIMQRLLDSAGSDRHLIGQPNGPITATQREALTHAMHGITPVAARYEQ
ncbi:MAG: hypothetical protein JWQ10_3099, partial [Herbaspirillum sp.]|nr:hypothetical protein [Herbaspirillum sp.]